MQFREKLTELRQAAGLTQDALAAKSGVPLPTVRKYEQGQRLRVPFSAVIALAKALNVDCLAFAACTDMIGEPPAEEVKPAAKRKRK